MGHSCNLIVIRIRRVLGDLGIPLGHDFNDLILEWGMLLAYEVTHCQVIVLVLRCKIKMRVNTLHPDIYFGWGSDFIPFFVYDRRF